MCEMNAQRRQTREEPESVALLNAIGMSKTVPASGAVDVEEALL